MHVLLTGGSGFLGKHMAMYLLEKGVTVFSVGRNKCPVPGVKNLIVPVMTADVIESVLATHNVLVDAVIHLAAAGVRMSERDFPMLMHMNVVLPAEMVALAKKIGVQAVVMTGSCAEYSKPMLKHPSIESDPLQCIAPYGSTKAAGGVCALSQAAVLGIPVAWMRVFNLFGEGELPHRLYPAALHSLIHGLPIRMRAGYQVRDFLYVKDACDGLWAALQGLLAQRMRTGAYNLSTGTGLSVKEFIVILARCLHVDVADLSFDVSALPEEESTYLVGDPALFNDAVGWESRYTVQEGLLDALHHRAIDGIELK